jgi:KaiC/GvpD/RAD55 family RecA-like ATPase
MMALGDVAATQPWPVFACGDDKQPVVATGFKAATSDRAQILAQFDRPGATMIGVPTGQRSGIVVIDVDIKEGRDGREWLDRNAGALPQTRTHRTRSGGLHLLFRRPDGVEIRNSASRIAAGIDVRGEGGYIIVPPSPGYAVADDSDPADMPPWLIRACLRQEPPPPPPPRPQERHERYTQAAIDAEVLAVARAGEGTRNDTLNKAAVRLGTLVGAGQMSRGDAEAELQRAGQAAGLAPREVAATVKSGLDFGIAHPREMPRSNGAQRPHATAPPPPDSEADYGWEERSARGETPHGDEWETREAPPGERKRGPAYGLTWFADIGPSLDADDFVQGLLCDGSSAVVYGASNAGKTFWATDLALHVAAKMTWNGRRVEQGGVIYCALEGSKRFVNRVSAWRRQHGLVGKALPFAAVQSSVNLLAAGDKDLHKLIETIRQAQEELGANAAFGAMPVRLVVIDTLSRAMAGGNENAPEDMGALVRAMDRIREETGVCVLFIHHSGKDQARGMRGHTSLQAAIDTEIEVVVAEDKSRTAEVLKQRDLEKGDVFGFTLRQLELGQNRHGEPVTSCVVEAGEVSREHPGDGLRQMGKAMRDDTSQTERAREVLLRVLLDNPARPTVGVPNGYRCCIASAWRERFYTDAMPGDEPEAKKKAFQRASRRLVANNVVGMANNLVWLCEGGPPA